ncbi:MAG: sigma-54-dependent transcriptional regulator [Rhizobiaceae bacterium]
MSQSILIVDDEPVQRRLLEAAVLRMGYTVLTANNGVEALAYLEGPQAADIALVILDLVMPEMDGMTVLSRLRDKEIELPVIVQTGQGGIDTVINAMRTGAFDFVVKPVSPERLQVSISNALKVKVLEGEFKRIKRATSGTMTFDDIVTSSPAMERVLRLGEKASQSNIPIIIEGESGVGKEVIARAIQGSGKRRGKPFVTVNCGAIPDNLVESILFGHEKGSFTGATDKHAGKFVEADGGTLFLDEIGDLPLDAQVKLLRAIQEGEVEPVGGRKPVKVDIRIISATHRNLVEQVKAGRFREDLYYRINVFPIHIPPLRERREDIPQLVRKFIARFAAEEGRNNLKGISSAALAMLQAYHWQGNVRQLENAVFRAVVMCDGGELKTEDFPQIMSQSSRLEMAANVVQFEAPAFVETARAEPHVAPEPDHGDTLSIMNQGGDIRPLVQMEEELIRRAIAHYDGQMSEVARKLGIGRSTLYRKLKDFGIFTDEELGSDSSAA